MSAQPVAEAAAAGQQHEASTVEPPSRPEPATPRPDHVTSHSNNCYWDVRECRWECNAG